MSNKRTKLLYDWINMSFLSIMKQLVGTMAYVASETPFDKSMAIYPLSEGLYYTEFLQVEVPILEQVYITEEIITQY